jgi:hypothetical protein
VAAGKRALAGKPPELSAMPPRAQPTRRRRREDDDPDFVPPARAAARARAARSMAERRSAQQQAPQQAGDAEAPAAAAEQQQEPAGTAAQRRAEARAAARGEEGPPAVATRNSFRRGLLSVAHILLFEMALRTWSCSECGALMWEQERTGMHACGDMWAEKRGAPAPEEHTESTKKEQH